ncbi:hypothetical protein B0A49_13987, partial [Cryomyces minteri]
PESIRIGRTVDHTGGVKAWEAGIKKAAVGHGGNVVVLQAARDAEARVNWDRFALGYGPMGENEPANLVVDERLESSLKAEAQRFPDSSLARYMGKWYYGLG